MSNYSGKKCLGILDLWKSLKSMREVRQLYFPSSFQGQVHPYKCWNPSWLLMSPTFPFFCLQLDLMDASHVLIKNSVPLKGPAQKSSTGCLQQLVLKKCVKLLWQVWVVPALCRLSSDPHFSSLLLFSVFIGGHQHMSSWDQAHSFTVFYSSILLLQNQVLYTYLKKIVTELKRWLIG